MFSILSPILYNSSVFCPDQSQPRVHDAIRGPLSRKNETRIGTLRSLPVAKPKPGEAQGKHLESKRPATVKK